MPEEPQKIQTSIKLQSLAAIAGYLEEKGLPLTLRDTCGLESATTPTWIVTLGDDGVINLKLAGYHTKLKSLNSMDITKKFELADPKSFDKLVGQIKKIHQLWHLAKELES